MFMPVSAVTTLCWVAIPAAVLYQVLLGLESICVWGELLGESIYFLIVFEAQKARGGGKGRSGVSLIQ